MQSDVAVVMTTVCRPSLARAIRSVFRQDHKQRIHLLVGVDTERFGRFEDIYRDLEPERPENVAMTCLNLGYSTSARHGGVHSCWFGGSLRTALTFLASARHVAYLDDDDWYEPQHLRLLRAAIEGKSWAFSLCNYADPERGIPLAPDDAESLGPGKGIFKERYNGFVRPSALMLDKLELAPILHIWSESPFPTGDGEDRLIFNELLDYPDYGETRVPTVNYALDPKDGNHPGRMRHLASKGIKVEPFQRNDSVR